MPTNEMRRPQGSEIKAVALFAASVLLLATCGFFLNAIDFAARAQNPTLELLWLALVPFSMLLNPSAPALIFPIYPTLFLLGIWFADRRRARVFRTAALLICIMQAFVYFFIPGFGPSVTWGVLGLAVAFIESLAIGLVVKVIRVQRAKKAS